eukprot:gnl/MRDRNA2_/MRDRNA2_100827_c0_seq1.p1 gnl/MRDRNA2_/MRDRNA2_100827_c0~~gnl/MRDRNA2_/MRDRNA2_100827_c0_seq1.p1  ORF type:complete len:737 (-),score=228.57 gnl/MRDRNA2_/MRDRNA2_100827_c0_seq1:193-2223(-)
MAGLEKIIPMLPDWLQDDILKPEFKENCEMRFSQLDEDGSNELSIAEIFPLLLELTGEKPIHIEKKHCMRFISAFDKDGNGHLDIEEFTNFVRFAMAMVYLEGERLKEQQAAAQARLEETMSKVNADLGDLQKTISKMPLPVKKMMENVENTKTFKDRWNALDSDRSGTLEIHELLPLVQELCEGQGVEGARLDVEQCATFAQQFDENGDGVISKREFADFIRFCLVMSFVDQQKAQQEEIEAIEEAAQSSRRGPDERKTSVIRKKASVIDISEEDMELFQMTTEEESKIAKIQAAYRGKKDRKAAAKKKEQKELQDWTDDIGDDADVMARKLQQLHRQKIAKRLSHVQGHDDDQDESLKALQKQKAARELKKQAKRKSVINQSSAQGGDSNLMAALAEEELHGEVLDGDFDMSQLSEEHQARLKEAQNATQSNAEIMRKKKELEQRQRDEERRWQEERREAELKEWALSFGVIGDMAASKIQKFWRSGASGLLTQKAQEQIDIEQYEDRKKPSKLQKGKKDHLQNELREWEASQNPKELEELRRKKAQKDAQLKKKKLGFEKAGSQPDQGRSPRPSPRSGLQHTKTEPVNPEDFERPECEEAAKKLQAIQRGKIARAQTAELRKEKQDNKHDKKEDFQEFEGPEYEAAAQKLQAIHRGKVSRSQTDKLRREKSKV